MLKKWINIILCVWLINAVTYAQTNTIADHNYTCAACSSANTWADYLFQAFDDDGSLPAQAHHAKLHRYYVSSKNHSQTFISGKLPEIIFRLPKNIVKRSIGTCLNGMAVLPAYYSFLFRLNPF